MMDQLYIISTEGEVLFRRVYNGHVSHQSQVKLAVNRLVKEDIILSKRVEETDPISIRDGVTIYRYFVDGIFLIAARAKRTQSSSATIIAFLSQFASSIQDCFFGEETPTHFNTLIEAVRRDPVAIMQILEDAVDTGGCITNSLLPSICQASSLLSYPDLTLDEIRDRTVLSLGHLPWRPQGVSFRHNEIFLEVREKLNALINTSGVILRSKVSGSIYVKAKLSGMPNVILGINNLSTIASMPISSTSKPRPVVSFDYARFHPCVSLQTYSVDEQVEFTPPSAPFDLMNYWASSQISSAVEVGPITWKIEGEESITVRVEIRASPHLPSKVVLKDVSLNIPLPSLGSEAECELFSEKSRGKLTIDPFCREAIWHIKSLAPEDEYCEATIQVSRINAPSPLSIKRELPILFPSGRSSVRLDFEIPNFSASGVEIKYIKVVENTLYETTKWIRYLTSAGTVEIRTRLQREN